MHRQLSEDRRERHWRNAELLLHASGTLALPEDQQPAGAADAGDPATNEGGGRVPRRLVGAHVGRGPATACCRNQVGYQTLPADGPAGRSRSHRLTALLWARMGAQSKTTETQQPSNLLTKIESVKNSGHYRNQLGLRAEGVLGSAKVETDGLPVIRPEPYSGSRLRSRSRLSVPIPP